MKMALGQINVTVGDLKGNATIIKNFIEQAKKEQADIIAFPELSITGYPPQDLLLNSNRIREFF
jgi:NAD+ synthase (glutamine-hydrolysing)